MPSHSHRLCFAGTQAPVTVYKVTLRKPTLECIAKVVGRGWAADAEVSAHSALCQVPATRVVPLERPPTTLSCGRRVLFMRPLDQGFGKDNTFASFCRHAADLFDVSGWCLCLCVCLSLCVCGCVCVWVCLSVPARCCVRACCDVTRSPIWGAFTTGVARVAPGTLGALRHQAKQHGCRRCWRAVPV